MLQSHWVSAPAGTFLAQVRGGVIQFPGPLKVWCHHSGWNLFRVWVDSPDRLTLQPVTGDVSINVYMEDETASYESSFDPEGKLWIPADLREMVCLREQTVMIRVEDGVIRIFLRKVFETLGFGP